MDIITYILTYTKQKQKVSTPLSSYSHNLRST